MVEDKTQGEEILHRLEGEDSEVCIAETLQVEK
jgi:hypothetical protein